MNENTTTTRTERLQLTRETLRALTSTELKLVAGGRRENTRAPSMPNRNSDYAC